MESMMNLYKLCINLPNNELNCSEGRVGSRELLIILAEIPAYRSSRGEAISTN